MSGAIIFACLFMFFLILLLTNPVWCRHKNWSYYKHWCNDCDKSAEQIAREFM